MRASRWGVGVVIGVVAIATTVVMSLAQPGKDENHGDAGPAAVVRVAEIEGPGPARLRFAGFTQGVQRATLGFLEAGRIQMRSVELGDRVVAGQSLARLDARALENNLAAARASAADLEARSRSADLERQRVENLNAVGAATDEELEAVVAGSESLAAGLDAARSQVAEAERRLGETRLKAPFSGSITALFSQAGEIVAAGQPVVALAGDGAFEVELEVPEALVEHFEIGQKVQVEFPMAGRAPASGRVSSVGRSAAGAGRLFPVLVRLEDGAELSAGLTVEVVAAISGSPDRSVPLTAIRQQAGAGSIVLVVEDGRIRVVPVETGRLRSGRIEVQGELLPGSAVVVEGPVALADGASVEIIR